jgi:hypothetical protein
MIPSDLLSVSLFKKSVAKYLPDYISVDNDVVLKTMQRALDNNYNIFDSALILSKELEQNQVNINEVLEDFLSNLADYYVQSPTIKDPIVEQLLKLNHGLFLSKIEDARDLQIAIQRSERKRLKQILTAHEEQQESEDIRAAFQRIERKEKKELLQLMELNQEASIVANSSKISLQESSNSAQKTNWGLVIKIAAIFVIVLIPFGISIFFFNGGSGSVTNGKSKNNKEDNNIIYAETGDLTKLKNIDIPSAVFSLGSTILETDQQGFGFAQEEKKISINLISFNNQIAYLDNKIQSVESKYDELKSKKIKNKKSILISLKKIQEKCSLKKNELLALEATYEFKNDKLKLFKQEKIDLKSIKVYSLSESDVKKVFYLKIEDVYFDLFKSKGKLTKVLDTDILDQLNDI